MLNGSSRVVQFISFCSLLLPGISLAVPLDVEFITYYDYPPFTLTSQTKSLTDELAGYLTEQSSGRFRFSVKVIPKGRLDIMMNKPEWSGIVSWINPKFVYDDSQTRYLWTAPVMNEVDLVAFNKAKPVDYQGPESLRGLKAGMILKQRYADVEDMLKKGELIRENARSQENVVHMLIFRRVDVAFISKSTLNWFRFNLKDFNQSVQFADKPRDTFKRHLLMSRKLPRDVTDYVTAKIETLSSQPAWFNVMDRFNIRDQVP